MMYIKNKVLIVSIFCLSLLGGCINLLPSDNNSFEQISLMLEDDTRACQEIKKLKPVNWQLTVEKPIMGDFYDTNRIVVVINGYDYTYAEGIRWVDKLSNIMQSRFIQVFDESQKIQGVGAPLESLQSKYRLIGIVRKFQINVRTPEKPKVVLSFITKLFNLISYKIVDSAVFTQEYIISTNNLKDTSAAFNKAFSCLAYDLAKWVLSHD